MKLKKRLLVRNNLQVVFEGFWLEYRKCKAYGRLVQRRGLPKVDFLHQPIQVPCTSDRGRLCTGRTELFSAVVTES